MLASPSLGPMGEASAADAEQAPSVILDCSGRTTEGSARPSFATGGETRFTVTATFGEGAIIALVDPETSKVVRPLYDAETTSGRLGFGGGEETTIVWTRMSGADGALIGAAIMSDGDVLTLTIDPASQGTTQRPFALFSAGPAALFRGACAAAKRSEPNEPGR